MNERCWIWHGSQAWARWAHSTCDGVTSQQLWEQHKQRLHATWEPLSKPNMHPTPLYFYSFLWGPISQHPSFFAFLSSFSFSLSPFAASTMTFSKHTLAFSRFHKHDQYRGVSRKGQWESQDGCILRSVVAFQRAISSQAHFVAFLQLRVKLYQDWGNVSVAMGPMSTTLNAQSIFGIFLTDSALPAQSGLGSSLSYFPTAWFVEFLRGEGVRGWFPPFVEWFIKLLRWRFFQENVLFKIK